jgi:hypothetical protein
MNFVLVLLLSASAAFAQNDCEKGMTAKWGKRALIAAAILLPIAALAPQAPKVSGYVQEHLPWMATAPPGAVQFDSAHQAVDPAEQYRLYFQKSQLEAQIRNEQDKLYPDLPKLDALKGQMRSLTEKYPFLLSPPPPKQ